MGEGKWEKYLTNDAICVQCDTVSIKRAREESQLIRHATLALDTAYGAVICASPTLGGQGTKAIDEHILAFQANQKVRQ